MSWSQPEVTEQLQTLSSGDPAAVARFIKTLQGDAQPLKHLLVAALRDFLDQDDVCTAFDALAWLFDLKSVLALELAKDDALAMPLQDAAEQAGQSSTALEERLSLARLLSTMANYPTARALVASYKADQWLAAVSEDTAQDLVLRVTCASTWSKLNTSLPAERHAKSLAIFVCALASSKSSPTDHVDVLQPAIEGLAVLTLQRDSRKRLCDPSLGAIEILLGLPLAFQKSRPSMAVFQIHFCLSAVFSNLTASKAGQVLSEAEKLKAMVDKKGQGEEWESAEELYARLKLLLEKEACSRLAPLSRNSSAGIRRQFGSTLLNLAGLQKERGRMLQQGAATILLNIRRQEAKSGSVNAAALPAYQAFAKLLITANPLLVLGPSPESPLLPESIALLTELLLAEEATPLQQFEAVMSLTNFASIPGLADNIAADAPTIAKVESMMLDNQGQSQGQVLARRAATQLMNNLVMCETGFKLFSQDLHSLDGPVLEAGLLPSQACQTRLHLLVALSDSDDTPTRSSASASLALLTVSPRVLAFCFGPSVRARFLDITAVLVTDKDNGLRERGMMVIGNSLQRLAGFDRAARQAARDAWAPALASLEQRESESPAARDMLKQLALQVGLNLRFWHL